MKNRHILRFKGLIPNTWGDSYLFFFIFEIICFKVNLDGLYNLINRSSRPEEFCKKGVIRNFAKFTEKYMCQSLFLNNVAGLRPKVFSCEICEIFKNTFRSEFGEENASLSKGAKITPRGSKCLRRKKSKKLNF